MASVALVRWKTQRAAELDQIIGAHRTVGGAGPGRRYRMEQLNHAYTVLLLSQFQGYCRDLHSECVDFFHRKLPGAFATFLPRVLMQGRQLDRGNPNAGSIGADFSRLGMALWNDVNSQFPRSVGWLIALENLNTWRNAIAHQDFDVKKLKRASLHLRDVKKWRLACDGLAASFDAVVASYIFGLFGSYPW
jgi:hypothetical protein